MNDDTPIETSEVDARPWRGDVPAAEPSTPAAPIIGWHIRMRGCDGSADWIELGPERPTDVPAEADVLAVVHAGASAMAAQPATEQAGSRTDGMGVPLSCGKPLCSPGGHHSLCHLASQPATAAVVPAGHVVVPSPITEGMHVAACKVLTRAQGLDGTPQRMLDAMLDAAPAAPAVQPGWLTDDWLQRHALLAADCPPDSAVVLLPSIKRMLAATPAVPQAAPVVPQPAAQPFVGWYCAHCRRGVDASEVTYHEQHTECGRVITNDEPPAAQQGEAVARVVSWTNGSYWRNYKLEWLRDVPEGAMLYTATPARQAVALMDEQVERLFTEPRGQGYVMPSQYDEFNAFKAGARATERAVWQACGITPA